MSRVSIIIPTYNNARFIARAVESALGQTCPPEQVIVVDDGSTDDTQSILSAYAGRIEVIHETNRGPSAARNAGLRAARGESVLFLDADDWVPIHKLEVQLPFLEKHAGWGLVYSGWQYVDETGGRVLQEIRPSCDGNFLREMLLRRFFFPTGSALVRAECFARAGRFDESLNAGEDTDMWMRIARAGYEFGCTPEPLFNYRLVPSSASHKVDRQIAGEFARLSKFFADPDLPGDLRALESQAYGIMHYEAAARYFQAGAVDPGRDHIRQALAACPCLAKDCEWLLEWIAAVALDPRTRSPEALIGLMFGNLPAEASALRGLRQRAYGRYHTAAAFSAYRAGQARHVREHILPAIWSDPSILLNRGFLSIITRSLLAG